MRFPLLKLTVFPETAKAVLPVCGQAEAPAGKLLVFTVQLETEEFMVKSDGKETVIFPSVAISADDFWWQRVPESSLLTFALSRVR